MDDDQNILAIERIATFIYLAFEETYNWVDCVVLFSWSLAGGFFFTVGLLSQVEQWTK